MWATTFEPSYNRHQGEVLHHLAEEVRAKRIGKSEALTDIQLTISDDSVYSYFVLGYRTLARAAGVRELDLYRAAFHRAPGSLQENFVEIVDQVRIAAGEPPIPQPDKLRALANQVFKHDNESAKADWWTAVKLYLQWKGALK